MAQCKNCGKELAENQKFCPACGTAQQEGSAAPNAAPNAAPAVDLNKIVNQIMDCADETAKHSKEDIEVNRIAAVFSYLGLFFLIPLLACKNSPFAQFHAKQGMVMFLVELALSIVSIPLMLIPIVNIIFGVIYGILGIALLALTILGIVNVVQGKAKRLPLLGRITWFG